VQGMGPRCPTCQGPVSPASTAPNCEFCGSPLNTFGSFGAVANPAPGPYAQLGAIPPATVVDPSRGRRGGNPAAVIVAMVAVMGVTGVGAAVFLMSSRAHHEPPPPVVTTPPGVTITPGGNPTVNLTADYDAKCAAGDATACLTVGAMYEHGTGGVTVDLPTARARYDRACKLGQQGGCMMRDMMAGGAGVIPGDKPDNVFCQQARRIKQRGGTPAQVALLEAKCREQGGTP
jgi:hypothetical protein